MYYFFIIIFIVGVLLGVSYGKQLKENEIDDKALERQLEIQRIVRLKERREKLAQTKRTLNEEKKSLS